MIRTTMILQLRPEARRSAMARTRAARLRRFSSVRPPTFLRRVAIGLPAFLSMRAEHAYLTDNIA
jgi:hypothetical protein